MNCLNCGNKMVVLWTPDIDHSGSPSGGGYERVCRDCTPEYYRKHS